MQILDPYIKIKIFEAQNSVIILFKRIFTQSGLEFKHNYRLYWKKYM